MANLTHNLKPAGNGAAVLALFDSIQPAADALNALRADHELGQDDVMVMTSVPLPDGVLEADRSKSRLPLITVVGAFVGIGAGLMLAGGSAALYVLKTGGAPILSGPPIGIIAYEAMMLVALTAAFLTALYEMRLPKWAATVYDPKISEGMIGIAVYCRSDTQKTIADKLTAKGAKEVRTDNRSFD